MGESLKCNGLILRQGQCSTAARRVRVRVRGFELWGGMPLFGEETPAPAARQGLVRDCFYNVDWSQESTCSHFTIKRQLSDKKVRKQTEKCNG